MSAARRAKISQKAAREKSARFLWHFAPPWHEQFDHTPWWIESGSGDVPLEAALWDLFRRHPNMACAHREFDRSFRPRNKRDGSPAMALIALGPFGPLAASCGSTWPKLPEYERTLWRRYLAHVAPQRGFHPDPRVLNASDWAAAMDHLGITEDLLLRCFGASNARELGQSHDEMSLPDGIASSAVQEHRNGRILISIDPRFDGQGEHVDRIVAEWRKSQRPTRPGKAHTGQWLDVIKRFEDREPLPKGQIRNDQVFALYRRKIAALTWSWR